MSEFPEPNPEELSRLIRGEAQNAGLDPDDAAVESLARFAAVFSRWNERINLAAVSNLSELVERHFVDSFMATRLVPDGARLVDVGSGGGLPALPLASLRPDVMMECFEPIRKKAAFLRTAVRELGLVDRVLVRTDAVNRPVPSSLVGSADVAMSRATLEPGAWLKLGLELVKPREGRVLVFATELSAATLPPPAEEVAYARHRRLLCYRAEAIRADSSRD